MIDNNTDDPRVGVSLDMKVNLGNYESAGLFLSVTNLRPGATEDDIKDALDTGKLAYEVMRGRMRKLITEVRDAGGV